MPTLEISVVKFFPPREYEITVDLSAKEKEAIEQFFAAAFQQQLMGIRMVAGEYELEIGSVEAKAYVLDDRGARKGFASFDDIIGFLLTHKFTAFVDRDIKDLVTKIPSEIRESVLSKISMMKKAEAMASTVQPSTSKLRNASISKQTPPFLTPKPKPASINKSSTSSPTPPIPPRTYREKKTASTKLVSDEAVIITETSASVKGASAETQTKRTISFFDRPGEIFPVLSTEDRRLGGTNITYSIPVTVAGKSERTIVDKGTNWVELNIWPDTSENGLCKYYPKKVTDTDRPYYFKVDKARNLLLLDQVIRDNANDCLTLKFVSKESGKAAGFTEIDLSLTDKLPSDLMAMAVDKFRPKTNKT